MPNHKLGKDLPDLILRQANNLALRKINYASSDFPLDCATLERATIAMDIRDTMARLEDSGSNQVQRCMSVYLTLQRDTVPGLQRTCAVVLSLPSGIYTARRQHNQHRNSGGNNADFDVRGTASLILNLAMISQEQVAAVADWANGYVRAHRHREMASHIVKNMVTRLTSTGQIMATWPMLATLVDDKKWRDRFRTPPVYLDRYKVSVTIAERRDMMAVEGMLLGAQMMQQYTRQPTEAGATMVAFERFKEDRFDCVATA